ncbi:MAG TPA: hypothetical protein VF366_04380 [Dehalococcoidia bacterium]|jgi:hypothetical protein
MKKLVTLLLTLLLLVPACNWNVATTPKSAFVPKILEFNASPSVISLGEASYLRWSVSEANSVSIDNGIGSVALAGQIPVSPSTTTFYNLTATNLAGESTARTQIIVQGAAAEPVTPTATPNVVSFHADRLLITPGQYITLSWEVAGATGVTISSIGQVNSSGTITVQPMATTTYLLTATNSAGTATAGINISVQASIPGGTSGERTVILKPVPSESGSLIRGAGYLDYSVYTTICAGDTTSNAPSRAFLSFDISSIPDNAVIKEAILDLSNYSVIGSPSYMRSGFGNMGALEVYHVEYTNLDSKAYTQEGELTANGTFTSYPMSPWAWDVKNSDSGQPVIQDLVQQGKSRCQFRIQLFTTTNWDSIADMLCFDNVTLMIKY